MVKQLNTPDSYRDDFQQDVALRAKRTAPEITGVLRELMSTDAVDKAPSML